MTQNIRKKRKTYYSVYLSLTKQKKSKWNQHVILIQKEKQTSPDEWLFRLETFAYPELLFIYRTYLDHPKIISKVPNLNYPLNLDAYSFYMEFIIPNFSSISLEQKVDSLFNYIKGNK